MPNLQLFPLSYAILSGSAVTTNGTSANFALPLGQSYRMTVELLTASSTTTNHSVGLYASSDAGTTYHGILGLTALTTSGQGISAVFRPYLGVSDAATVVSPAGVLGTTDFATNANVVANGPFDPRYLKLRWLTASTGTVTFNVKFDVMPTGDQV